MSFVMRSLMGMALLVLVVCPYASADSDAGSTLSSSSAPILSNDCSYVNSQASNIIGRQTYSLMFAFTEPDWFAGERVWITYGEPSSGTPRKISLLAQFKDKTEKVLVQETDFPGTVSHAIRSFGDTMEIRAVINYPAYDARATVTDVGCEFVGIDQPVQINLGLNDAWFDPDLPGQGFLVTVYPSTQTMFIALFTYETERPLPNVIATLGEPGHRWLTAQGPYNGSRAELTIYRTEGGVFLESVPVAEWVNDGVMNVQFNHCNELQIDYDITSAGESGTVILQRVALDRLDLCEKLKGSADD